MIKSMAIKNIATFSLKMKHFETRRHEDYEGHEGYEIAITPLCPSYFLRVFAVHFCFITLYIFSNYFT
ncbi:hypothetical protein FA11_1961 [Pelosinus fermentans A11]|nr:hypothetical protein FA11_1961 [Pelosinus fermentans A11]